MSSSFLSLGLVVAVAIVFVSCTEGNVIGRPSNAVAGSDSYAYSQGGSSSGYPVDTGPVGQYVLSGSGSESSSSGFSGTNGVAGGSFSGSQSQSSAESFANGAGGSLYESQSQNLGNAIVNTASQVQSAVTSGIAQLGPSIQNNVQNIANTVANGISSNLETLHEASAATAATVQNIANAVSNGIAGNLDTLNAALAASAAAAANIQNNVQNIANTIASGLSNNLGTLNAAQAASAATAANIQNSLQNIANTVPAGVPTFNGAQSSSQASSSAESGIGQTGINYVAIDRVGQQPSQIGNFDTVSVNGGGFVSGGGGGPGTFHTNTISSVTQNGQTVIQHEETVDRLGERPQTTSGTVVLDNNGQVIASEVRPVVGGPGNFASRPETFPAVNPGYAQGTNSVLTTSAQNGNTIVGGGGPTSFGTVNSASSSSGFSTDQTRPVVNGAEGLQSQFAGVNEQPAVVPLPQSTGNSFLDSLASSFGVGSGGAVGTFQSSSVSSSTNQNGQTVVTHQETSDRLGEPQHSNSETVVVNNGVVSGVTCVNNHCVTHGN